MSPAPCRRIRYTTVCQPTDDTFDAHCGRASWAPALVAVALWLTPMASARAQGGQDDSLSVDRIFASGEFAPQPFGPVKWMRGGTAYTTLEPSGDSAGTDLVRYDAASGRRDILVAAARLVPPGDSVPLAVEDYDWSPDGSRLLVFTNTARVWRQNTRGDYWVLDLAGRRAAQARRGRGQAVDVDVRQVLARRRARRLRARAQSVRGVGRRRPDRPAHRRRFRDRHQRHLRLGVRGGARAPRTASAGAPTAGASPTGSSMRRASATFALINNTDSLYSFVIPVQYPKAGTTNSAGADRRGGRRRRSDALAATSPATRATSTSPGWIGPPPRPSW